jgi:3-keto-5-aminohexanoate cleavage enzyme
MQVQSKKKGEVTNKVIITCAITGSRLQRDSAPYIPITPEEIAQSAIAVWRSGASVIHIHVRDPQTCMGSQDPDLFRCAVEPIREQTDAILCLTTSGIPGRNLSTEERLAPLALKPEMASFDAGSINLGGKVFLNAPDFLDEAAARMQEAGVKPEIEIFDVGMMVTALRMQKEGKLADPLHFQFVLGTPWGAPADPRTMVYLHDMLPPGATWSLFGIGRWSLPMSMMALIMGGHIRVGMEDNLYLRGGVLAKTNAELVERVAGLCREYGRDIAVPEEARKILGLKAQV